MSSSIDLDDITKTITAQLRFQRRWQLLSMSFYVVATVGTLLCTSAAGLLAAMHHDQAAAILAGISTVLVGTEKSLLRLGLLPTVPSIVSRIRSAWPACRSWQPAVAVSEDPAIFATTRSFTLTSTPPRRASTLR